MSKKPTGFKLGPLQKKWIKALESGKYDQTTEQLHNEDEGSYCCLGVANVVCKLGERDKEALVHTYRKLGLRDCCGEPLHSTFNSLVDLNDRSDKDFTDIAKMLRKHPTEYFKESK